MNTKMNRFGFFLLIGLVLIALSACVGLSQIQDSMSHFAQATHAASAAEATFLNAVLTVDCEKQFHTIAYQYSTDNIPNFKLFRYCKPRDINLDQIATRNNLMKAIVLYADKMQALATDSDDKELDSNSQTLAKNLNQLASTGGIHLNDPAIVQGVQAAIIEIGNMVLDQIKYKNIVTAAQKMQPHLEVIVTALKNENWGFGKAMSTSIALLEGQLRPLIIKSHEEKKADWANTFFNIVNGHILLMSVDPEADKSLTSLDNAAEPDLAKPVNDVLDAIVSGNKAIAAAKKTGGIYSAANDLYTRAIAAKDIYSSIGSSK